MLSLNEMRMDIMLGKFLNFGETIDELMKNIREVIELCLEDDNPEDVSEFVGIEKVSI